MKAKFNSIIGVIITGVMAMSCSAPKYATAQTEEDPYTNSQPPAPATDQGNYDDQTVQSDADQQDIDFNTFYDALSPYGTWENDPDYGQVWISNEKDFTPYYSNGNWAYSDAGWAWASNYSWGWAPFHYGRWAFRNHWMWVPGYDWAPSWVSWRTGGDYYGWAPLGPGINIRVGVGFGGYIAADRWNFCPRQYITSGRFNNYCIDRRQNTTIIRNTTIINNVNIYHNTRFVSGPDRHDVERFTHTRITTLPIHNTGRPGATVINRNGIQMYRPNVKPGNNARLNGNNRNNNRFERQQQQRPVQQQQPNSNRPQPERQQNNPVPQRQNQQPVNTQPQQRQPIRNTDRPQQTVINNRNNDMPDRRMAFNERQQPIRQQYEQPQVRQQSQPQYKPQVQQARPQQQQFKQPQQQFRQQAQVRQQPQQRQYQAQPRNNGGNNRDRNTRKA